MTFGAYPMVSLKDARAKLLEAKTNIQSGINPAIQKRAVKEAERADSSNSFEVVAREWFENKKASLKESYTSRIMDRLELELFPFLSARPIGEITAL
ncbi:MAG: integrase arm-type DNA-binding domain-containing protein, partial [Deltaproteobacteria bacterium]|nr:integrase arm-type DNA-binding domain-containing protein [Deltaproteobacteria bacterium]